jgi:hypothetical protein
VSAEPAAASCQLHGSKTLRTTEEVRIFEKRSRDGSLVYGCA